ncbi:carbohydrate ABC transporter permease [Geodermatophilus maliterrae]|uniref:Carbohydrate ABC transporter permease n=1 Tax=Geodermatophilus maliterrae TaxID=3162531 RepID=A0ABV3XB62_9ACTN
MSSTAAPGAEGGLRTRQGGAPHRSAGAAVRPRPRRSRRGAGTLLGIVLVAPLILLMLLVIGFPLVNTVLLSFQDQGVVGTPSSFVGLRTYQAILGDSALWESLRRSGVWLVGNLVVQTVLAMATALLLTRVGRWSKAARTWVLLPWVIPTVAVAVIWQWLTNSNYGLLAKGLGVLGLDGVQFFADPDWAMPTLILMNSWHWFPLGTVIIFGALQTIPGEVYEAAKVDGVNAWQMFWHITLPLLQPVLFALGLVGTLWSFNIIDSIYLVTRGGPSGASTTAPVMIYDTAFKAFRASEAAAMSVAAIVLLGILAWLYIRFAKPEEV